MGSSSQMAAARLMEQVAMCAKPQFIISTGDNFYPREYHLSYKGHDPSLLHFPVIFARIQVSLCP